MASTKFFTIVAESLVMHVVGSFDVEQPRKKKSNGVKSHDPPILITEAGERAVRKRLARWSNRFAGCPVEAACRPRRCRPISAERSVPSRRDIERRQRPPLDQPRPRKSVARPRPLAKKSAPNGDASRLRLFLADRGNFADQRKRASSLFRDW